MRTLLITCLVVAIATLAGCGGGGGGGSSDKIAPTVTGVNITPNGVNFGGLIHVTATATDNIHVSTVKIVARYNGNTTRADMSLTGIDTYEGQYTIPINTTSSPVNCAITVEATDDAGNVGTSTTTNIPVNNPDVPPPPPI